MDVEGAVFNILLLDSKIGTVFARSKINRTSPSATLSATKILPEILNCPKRRAALQKQQDCFLVSVKLLLGIAGRQVLPNKDSLCVSW